MVELEPVLSEEMINENAYHQSGDLEAHGRVDVFAEPAGIRRRAAAHPDHAPRQADGLEARRRYPRELEDLAAEIPQGDAGGIPPRAEGIEGQRRRRAEDRDRGVERHSKRHSREVHDALNPRSRRGGQRARLPSGCCALSASSE